MNINKRRGNSMDLYKFYNPNLSNIKPIVRTGKNLRKQQYMNVGNGEQRPKLKNKKKQPTTKKFKQDNGIQH